MTPLLEVRNLSYAPRDCRRPLLTNLNFTAVRGEYLALAGPNGIGKTTLLRCLDFILTDWTGEILLDGESIRHLSRRSLAQKIAFIPQIPDLSFDGTVRQFAALGRYPHLSPLAPLSSRDEEIIDESLTRTGADRLADRALLTLSGGERQRVYLAAALAQEPSILLLDEPNAFLDYRHQNENFELLNRIRTESGMTMIEVTHDLNRVSLMGARVIALGGEGILFDGPADDLMNAAELRRLFATDFQLAPHPVCGKMMILPPCPSFHSLPNGKRKE